MLVFKINLKNSATPQVHIYRYNLFIVLQCITIHIHGLLSQPNKCSLYYPLRVLKIATDRDLLHTISIVLTEYSGLYNDLCCLQQYTLQSTVHSWTIIMHLKVGMQTYNYRNTYKLYASHLSHGSSSH